ncbi:MAG: hypothetical protein FWE23_02010 [Chitinivibrionia bacterium]|nr:hypothetical protein [Chitinivibrionia bacterium]
MKKAVIALIISVFFTISFAQSAADFRQRAMTQSTVHFTTSDGRVQTADFWQLKLGRFEVDLVRRFPGEGDVAVNGNVNIMFMSGGYLEGNGFGNRGRINSTAEFAVRRDGGFQMVRQEAIEYIFFGGTRVKLIDGAGEEDLYIFIENDQNIYRARDFTLAIFVNNRATRELELTNDIEGITAIAFTAERARAGHRATMDELNR